MDTLFRAKSSIQALAVLLGVTLVACSSDHPTSVTSDTNAGVVVINAMTTPVDILVDGVVVKSAAPAGEIATVTAASGSHQLALRQTGTTATTSTAFTTSDRFQRAFAAVRGSNGLLAAAALDDTGSLVPVGATKLRVLHLAANTGELQVYRTQPDFQTPVRWQSPFTYQSNPNSLSAPYYQSTVGTWEVRIWLAPPDASGWSSAPVKVLVPLGSGEKKTVVILDKPGGGVRVELID